MGQDRPNLGSVLKEIGGSPMTSYLPTRGGRLTRDGVRGDGASGQVVYVVPRHWPNDAWRCAA
jgi:hypothetical protein